GHRAFLVMILPADITADALAKVFDIVKRVPFPVSRLGIGDADHEHLHDPWLVPIFIEFRTQDIGKTADGQPEGPTRGAARILSDQGIVRTPAGGMAKREQTSIGQSGGEYIILAQAMRLLGLLARQRQLQDSAALARVDLSREAEFARPLGHLLHWRTGGPG